MPESRYFATPGCSGSGTDHRVLPLRCANRRCTRITATIPHSASEMYWALLNALDETVDVERLRGNLRMAVSGGSALPVQILQDFQTRFGIGILEGYGLTECSPVVACGNPLQHLDRPGSVGLPLPGTDVAIRDAGGPDLTSAGQSGDDPAVFARLARVREGGRDAPPARPSHRHVAAVSIRRCAATQPGGYS